MTRFSLSGGGAAALSPLVVEGTLVSADFDLENGGTIVVEYITKEGITVLVQMSARELEEFSAKIGDLRKVITKAVQQGRRKN